MDLFIIKFFRISFPLWNSNFFSALFSSISVIPLLWGKMFKTNVHQLSNSV